MIMVNTKLRTTISSVTGSRVLKSSVTCVPPLSDLPKLPVRTPVDQRTYWSNNEPVRPLRSRNAVTFCGVALTPRMAAAASPGTRRSIVNTNMETRTMFKARPMTRCASGTLSSASFASRVSIPDPFAREYCIHLIDSQVFQTFVTKVTYGPASWLLSSHPIVARRILPIWDQNDVSARRRKGSSLL